MRRRAIALVLAICALAIPASASAYSSPNAITGGSEQSSQPPASPDHSSVNAITGGSGASSGPAVSGSSHEVVRDYASPNAITGAEQPTLVAGSPAGADNGFDWPSALVGAGSAMAIVALGGAAFLTVRRRTEVSPSASTS